MPGTAWSCRSASSSVLGPVHRRAWPPVNDRHRDATGRPGRSGHLGPGSGRWSLVLGPTRCEAAHVNVDQGTSRTHTVLASADDGGFASLRDSGPPRAARYVLGRQLRGSTPRSALGDWTPPPDRPDVVDQVIRSNEGRLPWLVPVRIGRMVASPYAFLRGAANVHAADFAGLPATGITPVVCGDAHLGNFGFYASPERDLV